MSIEEDLEAQHRAFPEIDRGAREVGVMVLREVMELETGD